MTQYSTFAIFKTRWRAILTMTPPCVSPFLPSWKVWPRTGSSRCHPIHSTSSLRRLKHMPLTRRLRETATTSSLSEWGKEITSSRTSISSRINSPKSPIVGKKLQPSHSLAGCKLLTHSTSTSWSTLPRWERYFFELSLTSNLKRPWRLHPTTLQTGELMEENQRSLTKLLTDIRGSRLQEAGAPDPRPELALRWPIDEILHYVEASDKIFNTFKDQSWVRRSRPLQYDTSLPGRRIISPTTNARDTRPSMLGTPEVPRARQTRFS